MLFLEVSNISEEDEVDEVRENAAAPDRDDLADVLGTRTFSQLDHYARASAATFIVVPRPRSSTQRVERPES
jgi:hypothetical protein